MSEQIIRPYSILIYGLQDDFIGTLKPFSLEGKGHINNPKMILKNDGTQQLSLSIPMYYTNPEDGKRILNPMWATTRSNELLTNLRKLKVIFLNEEARPSIYEFIITSKTDRHENAILICDIQAEGLAFRELGGTGYTLSLTQDDFLADYEDWVKKPESRPEPVMNIQYWCDKVFANSGWDYEIKMNWGTYGNSLSTDKVYETEYAADWKVSDNKLIPSTVEATKEKYRAINCSESNRYNITQDIAEAFGVYCQYVYEYNDNYNIVGKKVIFYNNFFIDDGANWFDVNYPQQMSNIKRTVEAEDVVTKMYVDDIEDNSLASGIISIMDADANKSGENYILDFGYLKAVGSISDEQYEAIETYEVKMAEYNKKMKGLSATIALNENNLTKYKAIAENARTAIKQASEQINNAQLSISALLGKDETLNRQYQTIVPKTNLAPEANESDKYIAVFSDAGVIATTVKLYYHGIIDNEKKEVATADWHLTYDNTLGKDIATGIAVSESVYATQTQNLRTLEVCYSYRPRLKHDRIITIYQQVINNKTYELQDAERMANSLESSIENNKVSLEQARAEKQIEVGKFERLMGPALREGNWHNDDYKDYSVKHTAQFERFNASNNGVELKFDNQLFDNEITNYEEVGVLQEKKYYPIVPLDKIDIEETLQEYKDLPLFFAYDVTHNGINGAGEAVQRKTTYTIGINAGAQYAYLSKNGQITQALMFTDYVDIVQRMTQASTSAAMQVDNFRIIVNVPELGQVTVATCSAPIVENLSGYEIVYPRLYVSSSLMRTDDDKIAIKINGQNLENYVDYYVLGRFGKDANDGWYITIKPSILLDLRNQTAIFPLILNYETSNSCVSLYLDALQVMKTNAYPKVSYNITISTAPKELRQTLYNQLNRIIHINDTDLFLDDVEGYISEVELNLDMPWQDVITVKDYKTKFEDLFSSIVASTEQMKTNGAAYDAAASAFSTKPSASVMINPQALQRSINNFDYDYAFNNGMLTIDEVNGIWAKSDNGVVAMRGGGILCATETDAMGNYVWNTGITPEGINASLITTGQLDTNLVRVFAGTDLALQLNQDGLFAYKPNANAEEGYDYDTFVVHNRDGLIFHDGSANNGTGVDIVKISWDGLELYNRNGAQTMFIDPESGQLVIKNAYIEGATIKDLEIGNITQVPRGITITALNGNVFEYRENNTPIQSQLMWLVKSAFITPKKLTLRYSTTGGDNLSEWTEIKVNDTNDGRVTWNNNLITIKNSLLPADALNTSTPWRILWAQFECEDDTTHEDAGVYDVYFVVQGRYENETGNGIKDIVYNNETNEITFILDDNTEKVFDDFKGQDGEPGRDGEPGKDGAPGKDGTTYYTWIKYTNDPENGPIYDSSVDGTGNAYKYIGIGANKILPEDAPESNADDVSEYQWSLFQGPKGDSGSTLYTWVKYADDMPASLTDKIYDTPTTSTKYIGLAWNKEKPEKEDTASGNFNQYTWTKIRGNDGTSIKIVGAYDSYEAFENANVPQVFGDYYLVAGDLYTWLDEWKNLGRIQGDSAHVHTKYSDNPLCMNLQDITDKEILDKIFTDNNGEDPGMYLGIYCDNSEMDSSNPRDYTWSKIKGDKGDAGEAGYAVTILCTEGTVLTDGDYSTNLIALVYRGAIEMDAYTNKDATYKYTYNWYKGTTKIGTGKEITVNLDGPNTQAAYWCEVSIPES